MAHNYSDRLRVVIMPGKGVRLTNEVNEILTPERLREMAADPNETELVPQYQISKNFAQRRVENRAFMKRVKANCYKRWLLPEPNPQLKSVPFGWVKPVWDG